MLLRLIYEPINRSVHFTGRKKFRTRSPAEDVADLLGNVGPESKELAIDPV